MRSHRPSSVKIPKRCSDVTGPTLGPSSRRMTNRVLLESTLLLVLRLYDAVPMSSRCKPSCQV
eukprot:4894889-Prymnesium_polylepis.1